MRKLPVFIFLLVLFFNAEAQDASYQKTIKTFDAYIQNAMQLWKTPGLSVVIVKDNNVIFNKAYGVKKIFTTKEPFTTSTHYLFVHQQPKL